VWGFGYVFIPDGKAASGAAGEQERADSDS
jgi:hypothetical protein